MAVILSRKPGGGSSGSGGAPSGPAGGVLAGTYPNPSFAADMATQAELDAALLTVPGRELAYVEFTSNVSVNVSDPDNAVTVVSSGAVTYSGARICIEFYAAIVEPANGDFVSLSLWDATTRMGDLASVSLTTTRNVPVMVHRFLTPSAASHTYMVKGFRNSGNGTVYAGTGASGAYMPGYIRITTAPA